MIDASFRYFKNNRYSLAVLLPIVKGAKLTGTVADGIMIYSFATRQASAVFDEVKNAGTNSIFIAGGPHPSARMEECLQYFDYVVIGEGEESLPELVNTIRNGGDPSRVKGIAFRDTEGSIIYTEKREHVDLNLYPPFTEIFPGPIEITRGCPYSCHYCQTPRLFGHCMRHRSVDVIERYSKYYDDLRFVSPNAFAYGSGGLRPDIDKLDKLLSTLKKLPGKRIYFGTFPSEVRPEFVNDDTLELVTRYCANTSLNIGAQSGSDRILSAIRRGHTAEDTVRAVEKCFEHGIKPIVDFIFGLPGETGEDQSMSLDSARWISGKGGKIHAHVFTPLPGTPFENRKTSPISPEVDKLLGKLALSGKLSGVWCSELIPP